MNPSRFHLLTAAFVCVFLGPSIAGAQSTGDPEGGSGTWWSVSAGGGGARLTCDLCDRSRDLGPSVGLGLGTWASRDVRVGLEGSAWTHRDGAVRESVFTAGVLAELHPNPDSGLHLIGGVGWAGLRAEDFVYDAVRLVVGAGWDLPLTRSWVVGQRITLDAASFGTLRTGDTAVSESVGLSVVRVSAYLRRR